MRVIVGFFLLVMLSFGGTVPSALGGVAHAKGNAAAALEVASGSRSTSIFPFKKKKGKDSNKVKKHNRSMGKKLKRKNDDTLRR